MSKEPYYCIKCKRTHVRGKIYEEHAEFAEGIKVNPPVFRGEGGEIVGLNIPSISRKAKKAIQENLDKMDGNVIPVYDLRDSDRPQSDLSHDEELRKETLVGKATVNTKKNRFEIDLNAPKRGLLARIGGLFKKKK